MRLVSRPPHSLALLLLVSALVAACTPAGGPSSSTSTEILWDTWGVPHIYAPDDEGAFHAYGWAQAHSHADLILRLMGESRGRGAEYWGEEHLALDKWVRTMGVPDRAQAWYDGQGEPIRTYIDAFVAGFNEYAQQHPAAISEEMKQVLPLTGADILGHTQRALHFTFVVNPRTVAGAQRQIEQLGSNAWAIAPARSENGNSMLVSNPHLPWTDLFTWFEGQIVTPGTNIYGATLVGLPFISIGFNESLGWTHTVNTHDGADMFQLTLEGDGYRFDDEVRSFETETVTLKVRQEDGSTRDEPLEIRHSVHGPIVAGTATQAVALRVVGLDGSGLFSQYLDMARASNLEEFKSAVQQMQMPMFTFMYADRDGNIMHHFGGRTPVRSQGDFMTWRGPVPGDTSEWLWTETHPFEALPTAINPESGWLQNANDPPWTTTFPEAFDADEFPAYMAPRFMHARAQRSAEMLAGDESLTFEEVVDYKLSNRMGLADRILDDLAAAVEAHGDAQAKEAMAVLDAWDRTADTESRGGVLFKAFFREMLGHGQGLATPTATQGFATQWDEDQPRTTPDGLADPGQATIALATAASHVMKAHGRLDVTWGEAHRLKVGDRDLPANGATGGLGVFRVVSFNSEGRAVAGDSYVAITEFSNPVRAKVLLTYGNASQPGSPHLGDQLELFARKELRDAWLDRAEVEANLESRETMQRPE